MLEWCQRGIAEMMRKATAILSVLLLALGCIMLGGCGSGQEEDATTQPEVPEVEEDVSAGDEAEVVVTATQSDGPFWSDVPAYATAMQLQKASWSIPPQGDDDYEKAEWRYYELPSAHGVDMVAMFYKMEMPKNGWQQMMEMEVQDVAMLFYTKSNENDAAYIWVGSQDNKTVFALMRAMK